MALDLGFQDKCVVAGIGFIMVCQNYYFSLAYWDLWTRMGSHSTCSDTSFWIGFNSLVCFYVTVMVCGMVLGAWIDVNKKMWWVFFFAHLAGGLCYTVAVIKVGMSLYGSDANGMACAAPGSILNGESAGVFTWQAVLYLPYCLCMAGLFYVVALKAKGTDKMAGKSSSDLVVAGIAILMGVQNFSFFFTFWDLWTRVSSSSACSSTSYWLGFDASVCLYVTLMVVGMAIGGTIDGSKMVWWVFFFLHLVGGLCYTVAVIGLGASLYGADGAACAELDIGHGYNSAALFMTQAIFYLPYCLCMAGLYYWVVCREDDAEYFLGTS